MRLATRNTRRDRCAVGTIVAFRQASLLCSFSIRHFPAKCIEPDMNSQDQTIFDSLTDIFQDIFDDDAIVATPGLTAMDVEGWDSLGNVQVFLAIEQRFGIRFSAAEIGSIKNVGELVEMIGKKAR